MRFTANLAFLLAMILGQYALLMTVFSVTEGGITAEEYATGARPTVAQTLEDASVYLPRINA